MFRSFMRHLLGEELVEHPAQEPDQPVKINVVNAIELKPDSTYLIVADSHHVSPVDIQQLRAELRKAGVNQVVGFMLSGSPEDAVQFVQSNNPKTRKK